jgi:hypothetical protein
MEPVDALRRLVVAPLSALTGDAELTGNPEIDELFTNGFLRPIIDALRNNLPGPIGQEDGLIDTIDNAVTAVAMGICNTVDPSAQRSSTPTSVQVDIDAGGSGGTGTNADADGAGAAGGSGGSGGAGAPGAPGSGNAGAGGAPGAPHGDPGGTGGNGASGGTGGNGGNRANGGSP